MGRIGKIFFAGVIFIISINIYGCDGIFPTAPRDILLPDHTLNIGGVFHKNTGRPIVLEDCTECHTDNIKGTVTYVNGEYRFTPSCLQCHGRLWERNEPKGLFKNLKPNN
jgi:hypothetical protein